MKVSGINSETGESEVMEVPDDIMHAAEKVSIFMQGYNAGNSMRIRLCGLCYCSDKDLDDAILETSVKCEGEDNGKS